MAAPAANRLYFGDCLDVMREDIADESVDLIYLDPPFNSKRTLHDSVPIDVQASLWPDPNPGFGGAVRLVEDPLSELIETDAEP